MATSHFHYDFFTDKPENLLNPKTDAHYPKEGTVLRLTKTDSHENAEQNSTGRVVHHETVQFGHTATFKTIVKFTIKPNETTSPIANGLAFFIVPEGHEFPPSGTHGNLGLFDVNGKAPHVFAVVFDLDSKPFVSLGIDIGSRDSKSYIEVPNDFIGNNKMLTLTVTFDGDTQEIKASVTDGIVPYEVAYSSDLSLILTSKVKVGLASSTSNRVAVHDVNYWAFNSTAP